VSEPIGVERWTYLYGRVYRNDVLIFTYVRKQPVNIDRIIAVKEVYDKGVEEGIRTALRDIGRPS
jgi:hypothetical protein